MDPSDFKILPSRSVLSAGRIVRSGVILPLRSPRRLASRARRAGRYRNWFSAPLENRYPPYSTRRWGPMRYSIPRRLPLQTPDPGNWRNGRSPAGPHDGGHPVMGYRQVDILQHVIPVCAVIAEAEVFQP